MTAFKFPSEVLSQHVAVLGKTGSGKTSTAKLLVEQVVRGDDRARVCILDTVKSDWWGLISSADGKKPGLPFQILGGPHGHVPLHSGAGKAIGELVGTGALPLSIIDMADFEAGGLQKFFVDFAPALLKRMRGVLYLVIEEAHELAPKERAGWDKENMAVHYAKKLATAGRSKGLRLVVATQRTQALHNALLGSCETLIAHRMTQPADQEPVLKWLKANTEKDVQQAVAKSLAGLRTGSGWIVSGEAKLFAPVDFPRISTFDNSKTPSADDNEHHVTTAPVDTDKLRTILGAAVKEAEENDPKILKAKIAHLEKFALQRPHEIHIVDEQALKHAEDLGYQRGRVDGHGAALRALHPFMERTATLVGALKEHIDGYHADLAKVSADRKAAPQPSIAAFPAGPSREGPGRGAAAAAAAGSIEKPMPRAMLTALAQHRDGLTKSQILVYTGYRSSGPVSGCFAELARNVWVVPDRGKLIITEQGLKALGGYDPLPTGAALREHLLTSSKCSTMEKAMLRVLFNAYPDAIAKGAILEATGYASSGPVSGAFARLVALRYAKQVGRGMLQASEDLFR